MPEMFLVVRAWYNNDDSLQRKKVLRKFGTAPVFRLRVFRLMKNADFRKIGDVLTQGFADKNGRLPST